MAKTTEEKIDYIYKELKAQKRSRLLKYLLIFILGISIYAFYNSIFKDLDKEEVSQKIGETIGNIVQPIAENMVNNMMESTDENINTEELQKGLIEELKNNPELIDKLK